MIERLWELLNIKGYNTTLSNHINYDGVENVKLHRGERNFSTFTLIPNSYDNNCACFIAFLPHVPHNSRQKHLSRSRIFPEHAIHFSKSKQIFAVLFSGSRDLTSVVPVEKFFFFLLEPKTILRNSFTNR